MAEQKIDKLAMDAVAADKAGMSYGQWMALHPVSEFQTKKKVEGTPCICPYCGEEFLKYNRREKKYCSDECRNAAGRERKERKRGNGSL